MAKQSGAIYANPVGPTTYHVKAMDYNTAGQMWLVRGYTCKRDQDGHATDVAALYAREFRYDGDRERYLIRERDPDDLSPVPGGDTWCQYDGDSIYKEMTIDGVTGVTTETARYDHAGDGRLLAMTGGAGVPPGETRYFHGDMLGTTRVLTDSSGTAASAVGYTAFGEPVPADEALGSRYGYAGGWGYQNDGLADPAADIGMLHVGARYYDPRIGRFLQRDPIGILGGTNIYAYAMSCPLLATDPDGEEINIPSLISQAGIRLQLLGISVIVSAIQWAYPISQTAQNIFGPQGHRKRIYTRCVYWIRQFIRYDASHHGQPEGWDGKWIQMLLDE